MSASGKTDRRRSHSANSHIRPIRSKPTSENRAWPLRQESYARPSVPEPLRMLLLLVPRMQEISYIHLKNISRIGSGTALFTSAFFCPRKPGFDTTLDLEVTQ